MFFKKQRSAGPVDFIVAGLGNPGKQYEGTRHNAGFMALEALAERLGVPVTRVRFKSYCGEAVIGEKRALLLMPQTFMNLSGEAVCEAMRFYKLPPERVLVMMDDISLPVGVTACAERAATAAEGDAQHHHSVRQRPVPSDQAGGGRQATPGLRSRRLGAFPLHQGGSARHGAGGASRGRGGRADRAGADGGSDEPVFRLKTG